VASAQCGRDVERKKEGIVAEERLKLAVFIDFDNIQIGVQDTLGKEFDVALVLEALKERGEVITKVAYGDWPRASEHSRQMTQHAVQMVQRNVTPRGDKNGADINLALDALEMAFTRHHVNAFAIVGGDSDFIALVEKLKQYDKRVLVIGGRAFTSNILQRNCTEFIAYENLLKTSEGARLSRSRRGEPPSRTALETRPLSEALPNIHRALEVLADRGVAPQLGLLKSTLLQLDSTFSEKDYGAGSFLEFMQKMERAELVNLRRTERGYLVEPRDAETKAATGEGEPGEVEAEAGLSAPAEKPARIDGSGEGGVSAGPTMESAAQAMGALKEVMAAATAKAPSRPLYMRQVRQGLRSIDPNFDERRLGFRGMLDLLHQAQREGLVRLQRDRKGVWRIFAVSPPTPAVAVSGPEPTLETSPEPEPVAAPPEVVVPTTPEAEVRLDSWSSPEILAATPTDRVEELPQAETSPMELAPSVIEEQPVAEPPAEGASAGRKARRPRPARAKSGARKTGSRRKGKEE